jgi:hypothetical protein
MASRSRSSNYSLLLRVDQSALSPEDLHPQLLDVARIERLIGVDLGLRCIVSADRLGCRQWSIGSGNLAHQPVVLLSAAAYAREIVQEVFQTCHDGLAMGQIQLHAIIDHTPES